jgi:hypothetical protein
MPRGIPADFALLVLGDEYAEDAAPEQACEVGFAQRERQLGRWSSPSPASMSKE